MTSNRFLDPAEKQVLSERIRAAERGTRGEIVTVIAGQSDGYRYIPTLWAAVVALSVPGLYWLYEALVHGGWQDAGASAAALAWLYPVQVMTFLGLGMLFQIPRVRLWLIPAALKHRRSARHAREQFFAQGLHRTELRSGILIFVSVAEHYVEFIADEGVAARVDAAVWESGVEEFVEHVRGGRIAQGFDSAVDRCREVLWEHFPDEGGGRPDELPNHLIEV